MIWLLVFGAFAGGFICGFLFGGEVVNKASLSETAGSFVETESDYARTHVKPIALSVIPEDGHYFKASWINCNTCQHCGYDRVFHAGF